MKKQDFIDLIGEDPEDMFGGDWENIVEDLSPTPKPDPNYWRVFRQKLSTIGITDESTVDRIQGFVKELIDFRELPTPKPIHLETKTANFKVLKVTLKN